MQIQQPPITNIPELDTWDQRLVYQINPVVNTAIYPESCGAKGDKITDDHLALTSAIADTPAYGNLFLTGQYRIASQLVVNKAIHITGPGIIWLDVGTSTDGVVVGNDSTYTWAIKWNFGGIFGAASSCRNALVLKKVLHSEFHFPVKAGTVATTGRGVWIQWGIINKYEFAISTNFAYGYSEIMPVNGIELSTSAGAASVGNANNFNCIIEGVTGKALYLFYTDNGGNDWIEGTYEGNVGHGIHVKGGTGIRIRDTYLEGSVAGQNFFILEDHGYGCIGPGVVSYPAGAGTNEVRLINVGHTLINGLRCNRCSIDVDSEYTNIVDLSLAGYADAHLYDASVTTRNYRQGSNTGVIATATPTTIFTPSGIASLWIIMAYLPNAGVSYLANARLMWEGTNARIVSENGALLTITLSGNNVQVTQNSGTNQTVHYRIFKLLE